MNRTHLLALSFVALAAVAGCKRVEPGAKKTSGTVAGNPNAPTLELYVMSECPYGVQVENAAIPVKKQLGANMNIKIAYIGDGAPGSFQSLHGPNEVKGDIIQLCAAQQAPDKYLDLILCMNENPRAIPGNFGDCAKKVDIDAAAVNKCADGDEGQKLLAASFEDSKKHNAQGSPTMFVDGKPYEGGRKQRDFLKAVCNASKDKPAACKNIPEPPVVQAVFFSDKRCAECNIDGLEPRLKAELGGLVVKHVDYMSDEGKAMYAELTKANKDFKYLPAVLVDANVEKDADGYTSLKPYMRDVGQYKEIKLGGKFDPTAEICDNKADDDGDGKVDCDEASCKEAMVCRPTEAKTIDLFVMSQCPYGAKAMIATEEVIEHFKKDISVRVHFIGDEQDGKLSSMHGEGEVQEDLRERCAIEHYAKDHQFMKYLACRSQNPRDPNWQPCAKEAAIDEKVIETCSTGDEGKKLLSGDFAFSKSLNIGASPTFLANNKREFNAIAANDIQKQYCQDNPGVPACKDEIKSDAPPPGAAPAAPQGGGAACGN